MKIVGIIAEYNPFHNGHKLQIEYAKKNLNANYVIIVMGGNFLQRGLPSIISKEKRTKMALLNGADLVLELPVRYGTSSSEAFALGGVSILNDLNCVDNLLFGSECNNLSSLIEISNLLLSDNIIMEIKTEMKNGNTYPKARTLAFQKLYPKIKNLDEIISMPNNILGIEYIKAINYFNSIIKPINIKRLGEDYHSNNIDSKLSSASAIRNNITSLEAFKKLKNTMPSSSYEILKTSYNNNEIFDVNYLNRLFYYKLLSLENQSFDYLDVNEDLEKRIKNNIINYEAYESFISLIKTKNYTHTAISRAFCHILLDIKDHGFINPYIRILGFNKNSSNLLSIIKEKTNKPLISKLSNANKVLNEKEISLLNEEIFASNLYNGLINMNNKNKVNSVYKNEIVII